MYGPHAGMHDHQTAIAIVCLMVVQQCWLSTDNRPDHYKHCQILSVSSINVRSRRIPRRFLVVVPGHHVSAEWISRLLSVTCTVRMS